MIAAAALRGERRGFWLAAALLAVSLTIGGGGWHAPLLVGIVEALALAALLYFGLFADHARVGAGAVSGLLLVALLLAVGLLQLVRLPPALWHALPGRALIAASFAQQGLPGTRWGISVLPQASRQSLLMALPPVAMFVATVHLDLGERDRLGAVVVIVAAASCLLGLFQVASGNTPTFNLYGLSPFGLSVGFFANRNHQGLFLAGAMLFAGVMGMGPARAGRAPVRALLGGAALLPLALCILGTGSRAGFILGGLSLAALGLIALRWRAGADAPAAPAIGAPPRDAARSRSTRSLLAIGVAGAVGLAALAALGATYQGQRLIDRFDELSQHGGREDFWPDVVYVAKLYAPLGTGFGTFDVVFEAAEPLTLVGPTFVNHAHNDYLELFIECGAAAVILVAAFLIWFARRGIAAWRAPIRAQGIVLRRAASAVVLLVLLHSLVDYPLRTEAIATLFAFAAGLLVPPRGADRQAALPIAT